MSWGLPVWLAYVSGCQIERLLEGGKYNGCSDQGDREAEAFQVSNDDTAVAQRQFEDKQPKEKTNTNCLVKKQERNIRLGERSRR
nr:zinc finger, CCHC-type [Tanacetum cinerariifolium]